MNAEHFPFVLLALTIIVSWKHSPRTGILLLSLTTLAALSVQCITLAGLFWVLVLCASGSLGADPKIGHGARRMALALFIPLSIALMDHRLPGFNNPVVFHRTQLAPDSAPFSMYLNFDKSIVAAVLFVFLLREPKGDKAQSNWWIPSVGMLGMLIATIMPVALLVHYVKFDPKVPPGAWLWVVNNLFFVSVGEEAFFRAFVQGRLSISLPTNGVLRWAPLAIASLAFAACHYRGGVVYVALAVFAGLFYGFAFQTTRRLEAAVLVHFGLNACHFFLFSYPALARS